MAPGGLLDPRVERFLMDQQYAPIREEIKREPARAAQILERFRETEPELHRLLMDNYEVIISLVEMMIDNENDMFGHFEDDDEDGEHLGHHHHNPDQGDDNPELAQQMRLHQENQALEQARAQNPAQPQGQPPQANAPSLAQPQQPNLTAEDEANIDYVTLPF